MKIKRIPFLAVLLLLTPFGALQAQIETAGKPYTQEHQLSLSAALRIDLPQAPDNWDELVREADGPGQKPLLFAWPADTLINLVENRNRIYADQDHAVYLLRISVPEAWSLNVIFDRFFLPPGAQLFLYNPDYSQIRGAYTSLNNKPYKQLATSPVQGGELFIELVVHQPASNPLPEVVIGRVSADMINAFGEKSGHFGRSGDCNVDISCPPGANWQVVKRSVSKFIRGGTYLCSGALINNTTNDGRPLLLTANHCIGTGLHARLSVFYFNYESPECHGGDGSVDQSISGSHLLATTGKLDFALVELTEVPPEAYEPYYAGWDRTVVPYWDTVTCIHHPSGDVKKISIANRRVVTGDFGSGFDPNTHWYIREWDLGTTEGGSSGSPLFNQDQRIIGDLTGGDASCSYNYNDYFQKFFVSWDRYEDSTEQLKYWLDPEGKDVKIWSGYDPYQAGKPLANFAHRPDEPKAGHYIRFTDQSSGGPHTWYWIFEGGQPATSTDRNPLAWFDQPGMKSVTLIVSNDEGSDTLRQTIRVVSDVDFSASQHRLVAGAKSTFSGRFSSNFDEVSWEIREGIQTWYSYALEPEQEFIQPGENHVKLTVDIDGENLSFYHQNCIQVLNQEVIFSGNTIQLHGERESTGTYQLGSFGVIPGTNSLGYDAFSNAFEHRSDTTMLITGITVDVHQLNQLSATVPLEMVLWDAEWVPRGSVTVMLDPGSVPFRVTGWLSEPLGMDTVQYAGFVMPQGENLQFASGMTLTRNESDQNQAWGRMEGKWNQLNQAFGLNSALTVRLETAYLFPTYQEQIKAWYAGPPSTLHIDLGGLVFNEVDVRILDMSGQQIRAFDDLKEARLALPMHGVASGIYVVLVELNLIRFATRVLITRG